MPEYVRAVNRGSTEWANHYEVLAPQNYEKPPDPASFFKKIPKKSPWPEPQGQISGSEKNCRRSIGHITALLDPYNGIVVDLESAEREL